MERHVEMQPAGRGMVGCCPFHEDRTPSFSVDDSRGSYHCFGCGASGDVITFMMQVKTAPILLYQHHQHQHQHLQKVGGDDSGGILVD